MQIPAQVKGLFDERPMVYLATVDEDGMPNVVPMLQYWWLAEGTLVIGDLFMKATKANIKANGKACISGCSQAGESYKLKGTATYQASGPGYDLANENLHRKKPEKDFKGVVVFTVTEVYNATRGPEAGKLMVGEAAQ